MNKEEKAKRIVEYYGIIEQLKYWQSEVFELVQAILEFEFYWENDTDIHEMQKYIDHIVEEIADNNVFILQFMQHYGIENELVEEIMKHKIDRQLKRMEEENK